MVYSFDVFDTLITRRLATPQGIFFAMQSRLAGMDLPLTSEQLASFAEMRVLCERQARLESEREDVTFDDIYGRLNRTLFLNDDDLARVKRLEIGTEEEFIIGVPSMLARFRELADRGERLLLISDMYLPRVVMERLLNRVDPAILNNATLYISSEVMLTKSTGSLFKHVLKTESIKARGLQHIGDNEQSDYRVPRSLGIRATRFRGTELRRWEQLGYSHEHFRVPERIGGGPSLFWHSRLCRCETLNKAPSERLYWELTAGLGRVARLQERNDRFLLGYSVAAPILAPFVKWVVNQAAELGIDRLYFVARDGQILHAIASKLKRLGECPDIDLRYIYGSRQAWHLPSVSKIGEREVDWILETRQYITPSAIAARLRIECEWFVSYLAGRGMKRVAALTRLSASQIDRVRDALLSDEAIQSEIGRHALEQRELLREYLAQQGLLDDVKCAVVDIGWSGRLHDSLLATLRHAGYARSVPAFYFGRCVMPETKEEPVRKFAYAITPADFSYKRFRIKKLIHVLEIFAAADHGSTVGYARDDAGVVHPILDKQGEAAIAWGVREYHEGVLRFVDDYSAFSGITPCEAVVSRLADLFDYTRTSIPEKEIADALGAFPYTTEQEGDNQREFGMRMTVWQAIAYCISSQPRRQHMCLWPEGSAARSGFLVRMLLHPRSRGLVNVLLQPTIAARQLVTGVAALLPGGALQRVKLAMPLSLLQRVERFMFGRTITKTPNSAPAVEGAESKATGC